MIRRYERHYADDARDYPIAARTSTRKRRMWQMDRTVLDQGSMPACVGYAWAHWLMAAPIRQWLNPVGIYRAAQYVDEWEGNEYDGTSVRAGAKILRNFELIDEFRATQDVSVLAATVLDDGPVCVGTDWYSGMEEPSSIGLIVPRGRYLGGHAWLVVGCNVRTERFTMLNSWGEDWGRNGRADIRFADMDLLLRADGECWIGREKRGEA